MKKLISAILILSCIILFPIVIHAQEIEADTVDMGVLLRKEKAFNLMIHTYGYGIGYRIGVNKNYFLNRMLEIDLLELKAHNQQKVYNQFLPNARPYVYGKLNNLYVLRGGYGRQHLLNRKPYWGGIELRMFYYGGLSVGFAKPVYLYIAYYTQTQNYITYRLELERYDAQKHFTYPSTTSNCDIAGPGPIFSGFKDIKIHPGLYGKFGFNFEFSNDNDKIRSLELGIAADFFPIPVDIMAFRKTNYLFVNAYLSYHFGKRYN